MRTAHAYARMHLESLTRSDGIDYASHGAEVAAVVAEIADDPLLVRVALLHDLQVHPAGEKLLRNAPLSDEERTLTMRLRSLSHLHIDQEAGNMQRLLDAFASDPRLLLLRMAHRLNDVRHLERFNGERRRRIATETLHMYTSISGRLGFHRWRWQMEDVCFVEVHPRIAGRMRARFEALRELDRACLHHARSFLLERLMEHGITAEIDERIKGLYSTYRKMVLKKQSFDALPDRLALRVIVETTEDCYRALGIIHAHMHPIHGRIKDYIGTPKDNGYQSIHTVCYPLPGVTELPIEIQIRTAAMHEHCELGIASHGAYKDWTYALQTSPARVNLFRNLEHMLTLGRSGKTFERALRGSFSETHLILFDPSNRLFRVQNPAAALDFACITNPRICHLITGVKINGRVQPLSTPLRDGDTVEIIMGEESQDRRTLLHQCRQEATRALLRKTWKKSGKENLQKV